MQTSCQEATAYPEAATVTADRLALIIANGYAVPIGFPANAGVGRCPSMAVWATTSALGKEESEETSWLEAVVCVTDSILAPGSAVTYTTATCVGGNGGERGGVLARRNAGAGWQIGRVGGDGGAVTRAGGGLGDGVTMSIRARQHALRAITPTHLTTLFSGVAHVAVRTPQFHASPRAQFASPFSSSCSG